MNSILYRPYTLTSVDWGGRIFVNALMAGIMYLLDKNL